MVRQAAELFYIFNYNRRSTIIRHFRTKLTRDVFASGNNWPGGSPENELLTRKKSIRLLELKLAFGDENTVKLRSLLLLNNLQLIRLSQFSFNESVDNKSIDVPVLPLTIFCRLNLIGQISGLGIKSLWYNSI